MRNFLLLCLICLCGQITAQRDLASIFERSNNFAEIVADGEAYFRAKHPGIPFYELTIGEHRDGEFVKFMRWRTFWSERLNPDGTLGDISAYTRARGPAANGRSSNPYADVSWNNISYENYIISQIGLGRTTSMAFHPTDPATFYVGAAIGGVWVTHDGGQTYSPLGDDLPFLAVSSIVVDQQNPQIIYIAVSDHVWYGPPSIGVYKSTDAGQTWAPTSLSFSFSEGIRIYWMEADPADPAKIFVATANGLYRTLDGFDSFTRVSTVSAFSVRVKPGASNTVYLGGRNGEFLKSTNGGSSFDLVTDFGGGTCLIGVTETATAKVFVRNGSTLHKSFDSGDSFTQTSAFTTNNEVFLFAPDDDNVIISGNFDTHRSDDGGNTFYPLTHWLGNGGLPNIHVDQRNMFWNPLEPDYVYFTNDGGVYRYIISTGQFVNLCDGLLITQFYDIAVSQSNATVIGGGSQDNGNVFRGTDGIWTQYAGTGDGMNQDIDPTDASIRYWSYQNGSMRRWQNGGNTNIAPSGQNGNGAWETPFKLDPNNANRLIAGYDRVYASANRGDSWTEISGVLDNGSNMNELAIAPSNSDRIYVTRGNKLFVKAIGSNTWTTKSLPDGAVSDIEVDAQDLNVLYVVVPGYTDGSKVYKSIDAGDTWMNISDNLPNVSTGALELYDDIPGGVFVGTDVGVFYRDNDLQDWLEYGNLPHTRVEDIEIQYANQLIRIGTHGRGVLEAPIVVEACGIGSPDADNDGFCDFIDFCPDLDNNLIGQACDDGDVFSSGETYQSNCNCEGGAANISYCPAEGSAGTGSDWIARVALNTIDHSSGKTAYSDFRTISTELNHGEGYPLAVGLNFAFEPDRVHAWIDYNRDGTFTADEAVDMSIPVNNLSTGTVTPPLDAVAGATTLRVRCVYSTTNDSPCDNDFGEVEDYTVFLRCVQESNGPDCAALPVDWLSFEARGLGNGTARLDWVTSAEEDLASFVLERALPGERFFVIGNVAPAINPQSVNQYQFIDLTATHLGQAYYRVKAVDLDGSISYSPIREVGWNATEQVELSVFPNPVEDRLQISLSEAGEESIKWQIQNALGQVVLQGKRSAGELIWELPVEALPVGYYYLQLQLGQQTLGSSFHKSQ